MPGLSSNEKKERLSRMSYPSFQGMSLAKGSIPHMGFTPKDYEDIVTARIDYAELDIAPAPLRLPLNSTAVRVRHLGDPRASARLSRCAIGKHSAA
jgi:hypothetical protein